jgi:ferredoxin
MRVSVDPKICQGHGLCFVAAPSVFIMDERAHCQIHDPEVQSGLEGAVRNGALACPEQAITIEEND